MIRGALSPAEVADLEATYDRFPTLDNGAWYGNAQRRAIMQPVPPHHTGGNFVPLDLHAEHRADSSPR